MKTNLAEVDAAKGREGVPTVEVRFILATPVLQCKLIQRKNLLEPELAPFGEVGEHPLILLLSVGVTLEI